MLIYILKQLLCNIVWLVTVVICACFGLYLSTFLPNDRLIQMCYSLLNGCVAIVIATILYTFLRENIDA